MNSIEKKFWKWTISHIDIVSVVAVTLLSILARYHMRGYISRDMRVSLIPWFERIQANGGIAALKAPVGNYNIPYQTLIAIMTYIPINPVYQYKIISIGFDFLQAMLVALIVKDITNSKMKAAISYDIAIVLPTIVMNSSLWGQCDSIYTFFCLISVYLLMKHKYICSFFAYGAAFAFKLQAVFLLPFFLFVYVKKQRYSLVHFLILPIVMILLSLGGIIQGQPISNVFSTYANQTSICHSMSINYPSFWSIMTMNYAIENEDYYTDLHIYSIVITIAVLMIIYIFLFKTKKEIRQMDYFKISLLTVYTCLVFLPNMHDRYGYLYIVLGLTLAMIDVKTLPVYLGLTIIDILIYANYLFGMEPNWQILGCMNFLLWTVYVFLCLCLEDNRNNTESHKDPS